ncbi:MULTISPECIES: putative selenate ABC transporter substrate-binding protein [Methylobacterium]|jgi:phosphonate transport system substrate-binding protein|uniref:Membrane Transport n=2 Tax=Methylobacterium TaxID=407 RepID=A0AAE8HP56_9HYPH|nr:MULTISPECIES: putative selenate ABC transporter substrate-binding protein [Methylobacterium]APT30433.1 membrane Transport [Methylobacterium phyllosphaerae]MBA9065258.1 phosphonate transport system substrate-binding protein [Methylobacterium fujisawaense]MBP31580.1 putative selenate ABC transporter substrate-binding protein [Methylobacterium sp.]MDE4913783.1 putative selenate ABC transporter substrate-binding protein [Methylobacterium sp. 092160098-2]MDH3031021.1 putative selenate ABC transp
MLGSKRGSKRESGWLGRLALGALAALAGAGPVRAQETAAPKALPPLVFTGIPDQDESRLVERFGKVAAYLEAKLGVPVRYIPVKSYPAAVTAFTNGQVQLAWFGGFTGVQARKAVPGAQAIAQGAEDAAFKTYLIANAATGLKPDKAFPKDIAGKTFTFGARASTSGRLMPEYFIRQAFPGQSPEQVFARVGFSGDHSRTIQLVQSGAFAVGAVDYSVWDLDAKAGKVDRQAVSVIWESPAFPDYQWTVRGDVEQTYGAGFTERLRGALVGITDPAILEPFGRSKFIPVTNAAYEPLVAVGRSTGLLD